MDYKIGEKREKVEEKLQSCFTAREIGRDCSEFCLLENAAALIQTRVRRQNSTSSDVERLALKEEGEENPADQAGILTHGHGT